MVAPDTAHAVMTEGEDFAVMNVSARHTRVLHKGITRMFCAVRQAAPFNELSHCKKCGETRFATKLHARACTYCQDGVVQITWLPASAEREMFRLLRSGGALHVAASIYREDPNPLGFIQTVPCALLGLSGLIADGVTKDIVRTIGRFDRYVYVSSAALDKSMEGLGVDQVLLEHALRHWDQGEGAPLLVRVMPGSDVARAYESLGMKVCARLGKDQGHIMGGVLRAR